MNLLNLRRRVRRRTGINSTTVLANSAILQDLNEAYFALASVLVGFNEDLFEEQKAKFNLGLNSGLYALPSDFLKFKQLRLSYSTVSTESDYKIASEYDVSAVDRISQEESEPTATNPIVDITNNYMRIRPKPTAAVTNGGELYYIALPSALAATGDTPVIPTQYHDLMAVYASMMPCAEHGLFDKYSIYSTEWYNALKLLESQVPERNINRQQRFRNASETIANFPTRRELPN